MIEWRPVIGYEGHYEVSDTGLIRSLDRYVPHPRTGRIFIRGRVMASYRNRTRLAVEITIQGRTRTLFVGRTVLSAFVGPCPPGMECCHNDGDLTNNALSNLRWDTHSGNLFDQVRHGTHPYASKTHCPQGHEYTPENTVRFRSKRQCRVCRVCYDRRRATRDRTKPPLRSHPQRHGTTWAYKAYRCRCEACKAAKSASASAYYVRRQRNKASAK